MVEASRAIDLFQETSEPIDLFARDEPIDLFGEQPEPEPKPSLVQKGLGALKTGAEAAGTLAMSGFAWGAGLIAGAYKMLPEQGIGEDAVDLGEVLEGTAELDTRTYKQRAAEAHKARQQIESIPTLGLREQPSKIVEKVAIPFQKVEVAKEYYRDEVTKSMGPEMGDLVANAFELTAFIGLPKLASKLRANVKAGKVEATRNTVREIHRAQLSELMREPNRLEHLAKVEQNLKVGQWGKHFKDTDIPLYNSILKDPKYFRENKGLVSRIEWMTPDEYLQQQASVKGVSIGEDLRVVDRKTIDSIKESFRTGKRKVNALSLEPAKGYQEGKHRAIAAKEYGIEKVPVQIIEDIKNKTFGRLREDVKKEVAVTEVAQAEVPQFYNESSVSIPQLKSTQEALEFGKTATPEQVARMQELESKFRTLSTQQRKEGLHQDAMNSATAAQFLREAIEVAPEGGGTTLSMLGTQNIYEMLAKNKIWLERLHNAVDVEAKWKRLNAPETGFAFKNFMSRRTVMEETGVHEVAKNAQLFNHDPSVAPNVVLAAENPKLINNANRAAVQHLLDFQEAIRKEYARRGVKLDFKGRVKAEILEAIDVADSAAEIANLRSALKQVDSINFVHIPSSFWFEGLFGKDPAGGSRLLKLVATQKRKNLSIRSLVDRGLVTKEELHPGDVIASYARRAGKDFGLLDLRDAAVKDKLAYHGKNKKAPENFVDAPKSAYILKDYKLHPALADSLDAMMRFAEGRTNFDKTIALTKMTAFYNPLFLPMYDMVQGTMLGSAVSIKMPIHMTRAIKDVWTRSPNYVEALNNGLASKPFNNPMQSYTSMVEWAKKSRKQKFFRLMESVYPKNWLRSVYTPSWVSAWKMDETVRMMSYNYLKSKGFSPRDAAQTAATFHGDYASVPAPTRKMLNRIFFTPTFKIAMGKLYSRMITSSVKAAITMGRGGKVTNRYAKGALYTAGAMVAFDQFMINSLGFKRDEFARRYTKDVETEEGPQQSVFTYSAPMNIWQKYYYRTKAALKPGVPNSAKRLLEMNRWEFHPLWRTIYDVLITNDNGIGDKIYSEFDDDVVKIAKGLKYSFTNIVRIAGVLDQQPSKEKAQKVFAQETSKGLELVTRPFAFKYMRSDIDRRTGWALKKLSERFRSEMGKRLRDEKGFNEVWLRNFLDQVDKIMAEHDKKKESK